MVIMFERIRCFMVGSKQHSLLKRKAEPPRGWLGRCWLFGSALCVLLASLLLVDESHAVPRATHYKQYAFIKLHHSFTEFYCLDELYHYESRWNPSARNGSHYGINYQ